MTYLRVHLACPGWPSFGRAGLAGLAWPGWVGLAWLGWAGLAYLGLGGPWSRYPPTSFLQEKRNRGIVKSPFFFLSPGGGRGLVRPGTSQAKAGKE